MTPAEHELVEYEIQCAYHYGVQRGREEFAEELMPAVRWMLAGIGYCGGDPAELDLAVRLFTAEFDTLMGRHIRAIEARARRAAADAAGERPGDVIDRSRAVPA